MSASTGTLRGKAGKPCTRHAQALKPAGCKIAASAADIPTGLPGGVAVFLVWLD